MFICVEGASSFLHLSTTNTTSSTRSNHHTSTTTSPTYSDALWGVGKPIRARLLLCIVDAYCSRKETATSEYRRLDAKVTMQSRLRTKDFIADSNLVEAYRALLGTLLSCAISKSTLPRQHRSPIQIHCRSVRYSTLAQSWLPQRTPISG